MKIILIIIALICVGAAVFVVWQRVTSDEGGLSCYQLHPVIVAFGDSLVVGYGAQSGKGFVELLATRIGVPITNRGVLGNTTAQGLARIDDILAHKPDIVILLLGGNDALQQVPVADTKANLDAILARFDKEDVRVVLIGIQGGVLKDPYAGMYQELATKYEVEYVPTILSGLLGNPDLMSDAIHPNAAGYVKIADRVQPALERSCKAS